MKYTVISHLMQRQQQRLEDRISRLSHDRGCAMTPAQQTIFNLASEQTLTLSELAQQLSVSRQAIQKTVAILVERQWVKLVPNPNNAAAKVIIVTEDGQLVRQQQQQVISEVEAALERQLGTEKAKLLRQILQQEW
ncbi:MarR family winged helix-turn-helix transcriptional regulator [Motilimonas eburnea]|uniref:MarR family winged helix-turn-helix transcriptional regulator n=1 Tax=Motilimonas eburnea TaxID=1737488 RepID=UPI001E4D5532|nr:MarR family transcriptional regulator [Motilimonas eburnea]MCE2572691.1 MarR family transcriptional regulator [Motilimonas eburnea]